MIAPFKVSRFRSLWFIIGGALLMAGTSPSIAQEKRDLPPGDERSVMLPAAAIQSLVVRYQWTGRAQPSQRNLVAIVKSLPDGWVRKVKMRDFLPADERVVVVHGDGLIAAIADGIQEARPSLGMERCINHTDDYPETTVTIRVNDKIAWRLKTTSNCQGLTPWNLTDGERLWSVNDPAFGDALSGLLGENLHGLGPPSGMAARVEADRATFIGIFEHLKQLTHAHAVENGTPRQRILMKVSPQVAALAWMDAVRALPLFVAWRDAPDLSPEEREIVEELVDSIGSAVRR